MSPGIGDKRKLPLRLGMGTALIGAAMIAALSGYASSITSNENSCGLSYRMLSFPGDATKTKSNPFYTDGTASNQSPEPTYWIWYLSIAMTNYR